MPVTAAIAASTITQYRSSTSWPKQYYCATPDHSCVSMIREDLQGGLTALYIPRKLPDRGAVANAKLSVEKDSAVFG